MSKHKLETETTLSITDAHAGIIRNFLQCLSSELQIPDILELLQKASSLPEVSVRIHNTDIC
jgi:hypothetical protein